MIDFNKLIERVTLKNVTGVYSDYYTKKILALLNEIRENSNHPFEINQSRLNRIFATMLVTDYHEAANDISPTNKITYDKKIIDNFLVTLQKGTCSGYSVLWGMAKLITAFPREIVDGTDILENELDDIYGFYTTIFLILTWNPESNFSSEAREINRFMSLLGFFHLPHAYLPIMQGDVSKMLIDIDIEKYPSRINDEFTIVLPLTENSLQTILKEMIPQGKFALISIIGHDVGLFRSKEGLEFYDVNHTKGEVLGDESFIANHIFSLDKIKDKKYALVAFRIFGIGGRGIYPAKDELCLENYTSIKKEMSEDSQFNLDLLSLSIVVGCNTSFHTYLPAGVAIINETTGNRGNLVAIATRLGQTQILQTLIDNGADINLLGNDDYTPLMQAVILGNIDVIKVLLKNNVKLDIENSQGLTAIMFAVSTAHFYDRKEIMKPILDADPNVIYHLSKKNMSALIFAVYEGSIETIQLLLDWEFQNKDNIARKVKNEIRKLAIKVAIKENNLVALKKLITFTVGKNAAITRNELISFLLRSDITQEAIDLIVNTFKTLIKKTEINHPALLTIAIEHKKKTLVQAIINILFKVIADGGIDFAVHMLNIANLHATDSDGRNILMFSIPMLNPHNSTLLKLLLSQRADPYQLDKDQHSPLVYAVHFNNMEAVKVLIEWDAHNVTEQNFNFAFAIRATAMIEAIKLNHVLALELLISPEGQPFALSPSAIFNILKTQFLSNDAINCIVSAHPSLFTPSKIASYLNNPSLNDNLRKVIHYVSKKKNSIQPILNNTNLFKAPPLVTDEKIIKIFKM